MVSEELPMHLQVDRNWPSQQHIQQNDWLLSLLLRKELTLSQNTQNSLKKNFVTTTTYKTNKQENWESKKLMRDQNTFQSFRVDYVMVSFETQLCEVSTGCNCTVLEGNWISDTLT